MKKKQNYPSGIRGRPIKLNIKRLKLKTGKDYTEVIFCGDWHWGARECDAAELKEMLDYCLLKKIYVFLMGDLVEAGLKTSIGASVYRQKLNPQKQMEDVIQLLQPLADDGLVLGALEGNHERRIEKETGISITKIICNFLKIPYLQSACWNLWYVGEHSYTIYTLHGSSSARFIYTKLKSLVDISHSFSADLIVMAHVHELADTSQLVQYVDKQDRTVRQRKKHLLLSGSFLKYEHSYVQERGYPIAKLGSPKIKLFAKHRDVHISY